MGLRNSPSFVYIMRWAHVVFYVYRENVPVGWVGNRPCRCLAKQNSPGVASGCVVESLEHRELGVTKYLITYQVKCALAGMGPGDARHVIIAYEPLWAIGIGKPATAEQANEVCKCIRNTVRKLYVAHVARAITIQYGGSMNAENARELLVQPDVDGGLIGGVSLKPEAFVKLIEAANQDNYVLLSSMNYYGQGHNPLAVFVKIK